MNADKRRLRKAAAIAVVTLLCSALTVLALPKGERVSVGDVTFERLDDGTMNVLQESSRAIVNYESFNIGAPEAVKFVQPDQFSAILNRVTGKGESVIAGLLTANGQVYIINPDGILFTSSARVNVGSLVASGLNMADGDFLTGKLVFMDGNGNVVNQGKILGQQVYVVGQSVDNQGVIRSASVIMAAGGGQGLEIDVAAGGVIRLLPDEDPLPDPISPPVDGNDPVVPVTDDELVKLANEKETESPTPVSGNPEPDPAVPDILSAGTVMNQGMIDAIGDSGGIVSLYGNRVGQSGTIDASGIIGNGGSITIYGEEVVAIGAESVTLANAGESGNGGNITIYSPGTTLFRKGARIEAKGGSKAGDGGYIEVSGREHVEVFGSADASAQNGKSGTFLIDPANVEIRNVPAPGDGTWTGTLSFSPSVDSAVIPTSVLEAYLKLNSVIIYTVEDALGGPFTGEPGNITIYDALTFSGTGNNSLQLEADNDIVVEESITFTDVASPAALRLLFSAANNIEINGPISTAGGHVSLHADSDGSTAGNVLITSTIDTGGGNLQSLGVEFTSAAGADITTDGGAISLASHSGAIRVNGDLDTSGGSGGNIAIGGSSTELNGSAISTANGDVTLGSDVTLNGNQWIVTGGGDVTALGTIDADASGNSRMLTITAGGGDVDLRGAVGASEALHGLQVQTSARTLLEELHTREGGVDVQASSAIVLRGGVGTVAGPGQAGNIALNGPVTLSYDARLDTDHATGADGDISVGSTIDADLAVNNRILTIAAGDGSVDLSAGNIGSAQPLQALQVDSASALSLAGVTTRDGGITINNVDSIALHGSLRTDGDPAGNAGDIAISAPIVLHGNVTIDTDHDTWSDGLMNISGGIEADLEANNRTLVLLAGDNDLSLSDLVGNSQPLWQLTANGGNVVVDNKLTVNDRVEINGLRDVDINGAIDPATVVINAGDDANINATIVAADLIDISGGTDGSGSVNVNPGGTLSATAASSDIDIDAGSASGDIDISENVSAGDRITLDAPAGRVSIRVGSAVSSDSGIDITSADLLLDGSLDTADATINESESDGIALGASPVAGGMDVSGAELQRITANTLIFNTGGRTVVDGISETHSDGVTIVGLCPNADALFQGGDSTFNAISIAPNDGATFNTDVSTDTGNLIVNGDRNITADTSDDIRIGDGITLSSARNLILFTQSGEISADGDAFLYAGDRVEIRDNMSVGAGNTLTVDADRDNSSLGTFEVYAGATVGGVGALIDIETKDVELDGQLSGDAVSILDSQGWGIGLGATTIAGGLNIGGAELHNISANSLALSTTPGYIMVDGITEPESDQAGSVSLFAGGGIIFVNGASTFDALDASANNGVVVLADVTTDTGSLALDGDANSIDNGNDNILFDDGISLLSSAGSITLLASGGGLEGAGALSLVAADGVNVNGSLGTAGHTVINSDNDTDGNGSFAVAAGNTITTSGNQLDVTANDVDIAGTINTGAGSVSIADSDGTGIGLGTTEVAGGLNVSGTELRHITAGSTRFTTTGSGSIGVACVTPEESDNAGAVTLEADESITFSGGDSTFDALTALADNGISVAVQLSTDEGNLVLDGDANNAIDGNDSIQFPGDVQLTSSSGSISLDASAGGMSANNGLNLLAADGVSINDDLSVGLGIPVSAGLIVDADTDHDGLGALTIAGGAAVDAGVHSVDLTAADLDLLGGIVADDATVRDSRDNGIGLGDTGYPLTLNISSLELSRFTVNSFALNSDGAIYVDNIIGAASDPVNSVTLTSRRSVWIFNAPSSFDDLTVLADDGIYVDVDLETTMADLRLDGDADDSFDSIDAILLTDGVHLSSAGGMTLDATTGGIEVDGSLWLAADDGVTINDNVIPPAAPGSCQININADADSAAGGTFALAGGVTLDSGVGTLDIVADDVDIAGTIIGGPVAVSDSHGAGIGLGQAPVPGRLTIDGGELRNMSVVSLWVESDGSIFADGIDSLDSAGLGSVRLQGRSISFQGSESVFPILDARADDGIAVDADISTSTGDLSLNGNANGVDDSSDRIDFVSGAEVSSAGSLTLESESGGMVGAGELTLKANGDVNLNNSLTVGGSALVTADQELDGDGAVNIAGGTTLGAGAHEVHLTGADADIQGTVNGNVVDIRHTVATGIGLGQTPAAGMNIGGLELQNVTANNLYLREGGLITVDGIFAANSDNAANVELYAHSVAFAGNPSTFNRLSVEADDGISAGTDLDTDSGNLSLDGDANNADDGNDNIDFADGVQVSSAGSLDLKAATGDMQGDGDLILDANDGINIHDSLATAGSQQHNGDVTASDGVTLSAGSDITVADGNFLRGQNRVNAYADRHLTLGGDVSSAGDMDIRADNDGSLDGILEIKGNASTDGTVPAGTVTIVGDIAVEGSMTVGTADMSLQGADRDDVNYAVEAPIQAGGIVIRMGNSITDGTASESPTLLANRVDLTARTGSIGGPGNADIDIDAGVLRASTRGNINIEEANSVSAAGGITAGGNADLVVHGSLGGDSVSAGGNTTINAGANETVANLRAGGRLDVTAGGNVSASSAAAGNNIIITAGGGVSSVAGSAGNDFTVKAGDNIGAGTWTAGNLMDLDGNSLSFESLSARNLDADMRGSVYAGRANITQLADIRAGGDIKDVNSMITCADVILHAGGNIGGSTVHVDAGRISEIIAGGYAHVTQNRAGLTPLGLLSAGRDFLLEVPNGGLTDGNDSGETDGLNFQAGASSVLALHDTCGGECNPLEIDINNGNLSVDGIDLASGNSSHDEDWVWINLAGEIDPANAGEAKIVYIGEGDAPGLVILNNRIAGGRLDVLREIWRTEAFAVETPELRSRQGIFGSPYFIHSYMRVSDPVALGVVDYILRGQAQVNADPEFSREAKRNISMWPEGYSW